MYPSPLLTSTWTDADWELLWAPYPEDIYAEVLIHIESEDVVLEIGAGDMRLAMLLAQKARFVYALEIQGLLLEKVIPNRVVLQNNLTILNQDARTSPFPKGITTAVLLIRHCTNFRLYADKLKSIGCEKLITNARWRTGIEVIELQVPRQIFDQIPLGWFACWCGNTGFKPGYVEALDEETVNTVHEVIDCPHCELTR
jgi:hypothetical protein